MEQLDLFEKLARRFNFDDTYELARWADRSMISYLCEFENLNPGDRFYVYGNTNQDLYELIARNVSRRIRKEVIETGEEIFGKPGMISERDYND